MKSKSFKTQTHHDRDADGESMAALMDRPGNAVSANNGTVSGGWPVPSKDDLLVVTVGGVDEIGMNFTMYGRDGKWIIVDAGVGFTTNEEKKTSGVTGRTVSFETIRPIAKDIVGMVITHAHADHIEGINGVLQHLDIPVYATPFACCLIGKKNPDADLREFVSGDLLEIEDFDIQTIATTHSIPESNHLFISGRDQEKGILHTGDWKFDLQNPNSKVDIDTLARLGDERRVMAVVGDSTNARRDGHTPEEASVIPGLAHVMKTCTGRVHAVCFASNVDRVDVIHRVAMEHGRIVAPSGRTLLDNIGIATDLGYIDGDSMVKADELRKYDRNRTVLIMTGTQGEENATLARLIDSGVDGQKNRLPMPQSGDALIYSARCIPGNEQAVNEILDRYRALGVTVISDDRPEPGFVYPVHVSGHPARDDLKNLLELTDPDNVIPVHGHRKDMEAHAELAEGMGIASFIPKIGCVMDVKPEGIREIAVIPVYVDEQTAKISKGRERRRGHDYAKKSHRQRGMEF